MAKILAAMSGGVDSAVSAALLQRQGHTVGGAVMRLHEFAEQEIEDAERSARALGIEFHVFSWQEEFSRLVQQPFLESYRAGKTPNPCVLCNKTVKFGLFLDKALELGYDRIATGHYARISCENGRWLVRTAKDASKDQTYMLYSLSQEQLSRVEFPMAELSKEKARQLASELSLPVAEKHDSQDICFIPSGDHMAFLRSRGLVPTPGHFIGPDGTDFGAHKGQEAYTVGQRRGLEIAYGERIYVTGKRGGNVYLGSNDDLFSGRVRIGDVNFIPFDALTAPIRAQAKLRYTPRTADCTVYPTEYGAELVFDAPQRAVTPGQAAVLYDGDLLLGGGTIL